MTELGAVVPVPPKQLAPPTLRQQLVDVVNHELRTPLAAVVGHAELLADLPLPDNARHSVLAIVRAAERLSRVAGTVSLLAEIDAVASRVVRAPADIVAIAQEVVDEIGSRAAAARVRLLVRSHGCTTTCYLDHEKVRRALTALVRNAVQHAPPGSQIEVEVDQQPHRVVLTVTDEGPGLGPESRAALARPVGVDVLEGLPEVALGLPIAGAVAEAHGGQLELFANAPRGMQVRLEIPQRDRRAV